MRCNKNKIKRHIALVCCAFAIGLTSCTTQTASLSEAELKEPVVVMENPVPGTVNEFWVEPMYDTVKVPAKLDPTGTYYRPSHNTVVEIRNGRAQPVQYPPEDNNATNLKSR